MKEIENFKKICGLTQEDEEKAKKLLHLALKHLEDLLLNLPYSFPGRKKAELWLEGLFSPKFISDPNYTEYPSVWTFIPHLRFRTVASFTMSRASCLTPEALIPLTVQTFQSRQ